MSARTAPDGWSKPLPFSCRRALLTADEDGLVFATRRVRRALEDRGFIVLDGYWRLTPAGRAVRASLLRIGDSWSSPAGGSPAAPIEGDS